MDCYEAGIIDLPLSDERINLIEKCAYSSLNRERRAVLEILTKTKEPLTSSEIGAQEGLGMSKEGAELYIVPLHAVGLIQKTTGGRAFKWHIEDDSVKGFIERVSIDTHDNTPTAKLEIETETDWQAEADNFNSNFK